MKQIKELILITAGQRDSSKRDLCTAFFVKLLIMFEIILRAGDWFTNNQTIYGSAATFIYEA